MLPFAATFSKPVASATDAIIYGVIAGIGAGYGVVVARRFGASEIVDGFRLSAPIDIATAILFGIVLGAAAAMGVALGWTEPYWVPEPVLVLVLYVILGRRERIQEKALGTAIGSAAAVLVAIAAPPPWVLATLAIVAVIAALMVARKTYWLMYGLYTFALVLALSAPGGIAFEAEERGLQILAGIALLVVGLAIIHVLGQWLARRNPQPELAPTT